LLNLRPEGIFSAADLRARGEIFRFAPREVFANLAVTQPPPPSVLAFRTRAAIFGNNAPTFAALTADVRNAFTPAHWVDAMNSDGRITGPVTLDQYPGEPLGTTYLYLDSVYPGIVAGPDSYVLLKDGDTTQLFQVQDVAEISKADFTLSLKITRLTLNTNAGLGNLSIRGTTVFAQSEQLPLARDPILEPVTGPAIDLDGYVDGLATGQRVIISGESSDNRGVQVSESAIIAEITQNIGVDGFTSIVLTNQLSNNYIRASAVIYGNVARANHGESTSEVLGGGDASQKYQAFTLGQPPLTYVSSPASAAGNASTLKVFVDDVQWNEVPELESQGPGDHVFVTRTSDDGKTAVRFGDGLTGARLPTGQQNVRAAYRKGIGLAGMVQAGQLSLLLNRPLGVRTVTNPQPAQGGEDPESLDAARENASLAIMTLDRIVSLEDYENFARAFAGVAKALATWTWTGLLRGVFVTVAGPEGASIDPSGPTYTNLLAAMQRFGDPHVPIRLASYRKALFQISARLILAPDRIAEPSPVLDAAETAIRQSFSFDARSFGQSVALSEVMAVLQDVAGVRAVEISALFRDDQQPGLNALLPAVTPQPGADLNLAAAELLTLDPRPVNLGIVS
jgi:predicted phage baseplate assembly protein